VLSYELTGQTWAIGTKVTMQLELGATNVSLIDGLGTWNNSATDALSLWNQHLERVTFGWVLNSTATKELLDGYNSVFFSNTIFGEGFGDDTLAATVISYDTSDYGTAVEADVVFNISQTFNSYRGALLPGKDDFHRVALHEFGHVLGLAHVYDEPTGQAIMEPIISNLDHLAADDIAGVAFLYGYRITNQTELDGFVVGQPTNFVLSANNNPGSFSAVGLPQGLLLNPTTGIVTGAPLKAGTFLVAVTAHGWPRDVSAIIKIEIAAASITSPTSPDPISVGTFFSYAITAANKPTSFTVTGLPEGIVYNSKTGVISGIPDLSGGFTATVIAHGAQYDAAGTVQFSVTPAYRQTIAQLQTLGTIRTIQDPVRDRLYVLNQRSVSVVDTDSLSIIATIPAGLSGLEISLAPDDTKLWVMDIAGIHSYDLTDFSALADVPKNALQYRQMRAGLNNKLYVTDPPGGPGSYYHGLYQLDATSGTLTPIQIAGPDESNSALIDASPDGKYLYASFVQGVASLNRYDISGDTPVLLTSTSFDSDPNLSEIKVSADGKLVAIKAGGSGSIETVSVIPNTLHGGGVALDSLGFPGDFDFGAGSTGYLNAVTQTGQQVWKLEFVSTATGLPFKIWEIVEGGDAFADHAGKNLFVVRGGSVDIYSLAPPSGGVIPAPKTLLNVSTRSVVGADDQRMIGGFIITGDADKEIAFRALGPSLPLVGAMTDPKISIYDSTGALVATNHNWNQFRDAMITAGLDPFDEHDAGLVATLSPGAYTAVVEAEDGTVAGVGLVELYDLSSDNSGRIANISTRSKVGTGQNVMIGGFIVGGNQVTNVLVRAIGPSLAGSVTGVLLDPVLELHDGKGVQIASNDDWRSNQEAAISATGIAPTDSRESAIRASLQPGAYTAIVRGKNDTTGVALVEIYNLDGTATAPK